MLSTPQQKHPMANLYGEANNLTTPPAPVSVWLMLETA